MKLHLFVALLLLYGAVRIEGGRGFSSGSRSRPSSSWSSRPSPSPSYSRPSASPSYSRPSPSFSKPSPSYGWNTGSSQPAASKPSPSYGWNTGSSQPAASKPATSYGWNTGSPSQPAASKPATSYGWNVGGSTGSAAKPAPSYGWNTGSPSAVKPSAPVGPPPSYPGLSNKPAPSGFSPPAYSPSLSNPPAYNSAGSPSLFSSKPSPSAAYRPSQSQSPSSSWFSSKPSPSPSYKQKNVYNTHNTYISPGYQSASYHPPNYGNQFGGGGLGGNTYIHNNYYGGYNGYGGRSSSGSGFLTNALMYGVGMHHGYSMGHRNNYYYGSSNYEERRRWSERDDRQWRATTQAPYFENKVPGGTSILPAAAVLGAATAFGLTSLLPLNVPSDKPLMYCNSTFIAQNPLKLGDNTYSCLNNTIAISCPRTYENGTSFDTCLASQTTLGCDLRESSDQIYCTNGTLLSRTAVVCESSTQFQFTVIVNGTSVTETDNVLNCRFGEVPQAQASFIPTTTTEAPIITTTEKSLSLSARMHVFFMKLIGKSDVLKTTTPIPMTTTTTETPALVWIPEALTVPPETTTMETTTLDFNGQMEKMIKDLENKIAVIPSKNTSSETPIFGNTTVAPETTTESSTAQTNIIENSTSPSEVSTEAPYFLAFSVPRQLDNGSFVTVHEPISESLAEIYRKMDEKGLELPSSIIKVPITSAANSTEIPSS